MAQSLTVLELSERALAGVRLTEVKGEWVRTADGVWPLVAAVAETTSEPAEATEETPSAAAPSETGEGAPEERPLVRALRAAVKQFGTQECALALPLARMLVRSVRLPAEARDDLADVARSELEAISPFPDEDLKAGAEVVAETDADVAVALAALPDAAAAEIGEALALAGVHVVRADVSTFGWLRTLWPQICEGADVARRLVLFNLGNGWDLVVLENGAPLFQRGLGVRAQPAELAREVTLSLLQCESSFADASADVGEVVVCAFDAVPDDVRARLATFGPVRIVPVTDACGGAEGVARRIAEGATLDVTTAAWAEDLAESRFSRKMRVGLSIAGGLWLAIMGVLFGYDAVYDFMTEHQKDLRKDRRHAQAFREVSDMKDRVALIERYSDRAHSALEILKAVSDSLPESEDMTFRSFRYARGESVRVQGNAGAREDVRTFTENLEGLALDDEEENLFAKVQQTGGETQTKKGIRYAIEAFFPSEEDGNEKGAR